MLQKPYVISGDNWADGSVVKIKYGNKYVIAKCKSQPATLRGIENGLNAFIRGGKNNPTGFYYHLFNYVKEHPDNKFKVITLVESENPYILLKREQQELDEGRGNPNMLNNQTEAHTPPYDPETDQYGWISKNAYLNFHKWLKRRQVPKTAG